MKTTVEQLLIRIEQLEQELVAVRQEVETLRSTTPMGPEERAAKRLARVRAKNEKLIPLIDKTFKAMGITGEPIGAEKVQEMLATEGINPEDNAGSRGIIEMREET